MTPFQSIALLIAAKWLGKMRDKQKRYYKNRKSTHTFKVGDLVLLRKQKDKLELKWEPNYRIHIKCLLLLKTNLLVEQKDVT